MPCPNYQTTARSCDLLWLVSQCPLFWWRDTSVRRTVPYLKWGYTLSLCLCPPTPQPPLQHSHNDRGNTWGQVWQEFVSHLTVIYQTATTLHKNSSTYSTNMFLLYCLTDLAWPRMERHFYSITTKRIFFFLCGPCVKKQTWWFYCAFLMFLIH